MFGVQNIMKHMQYSSQRKNKDTVSFQSSGC